MGLFVLKLYLALLKPSFLNSSVLSIKVNTHTDTHRTTLTNGALFPAGTPCSSISLGVVFEVYDDYTVWQLCNNTQLFMPQKRVNILCMYDGISQACLKA